MKHNIYSILTITAIITFTLIAGCQKDLETNGQTTISPTPTDTQTQETITTIKVKPPIPDDAPKIQIINSVHDFGTIKPLSINTCEFQFKNVGKSVLKITRLKSPCGCTIPKLEKREYAPGETGTIKVTYTAKTYEGVRKKYIYIFNNDPANGKAELTLKAIVQLSISRTPAKMNLSLKVKNAGLKPITVKSNDGSKFSITSVISAGDAIKCKYNPKDKKDKYTLNPEANLDLLKKHLNGSIIIMTDHADTTRITVDYTTKPLLSLSTGMINLFNVEPGKMQRKPLSITSNYNENFTITSIRSENGHIKEVETSKEDTSVSYSLEITPPKLEDVKKRYFRDILTINFENNEPIEIKCMGWYTFKK